jgi:hypothetical protein
LDGKIRSKETIRKNQKEVESNVKMDLKEIVLDGRDWIDLA